MAPQVEIVNQILILTMLNNRGHLATTQEDKLQMLVLEGGLILEDEPVRVAGLIINPGNGTREIRTVRLPVETLANGRTVSEMWRKCSMSVTCAMKRQGYGTEPVQFVPNLLVMVKNHSGIL